MQKTEKILGAISLVAVVLNLLNMPYASALLNLCASAIALYYMYLNYSIFNASSPKGMFWTDAGAKVSLSKRIFSMITGSAFATILIGILFRFQSGPFDSLCLRAGLILGSIVTIIAVFKYIKTKAPFYKRILLRGTIYGGIALLLTLLPRYLWLEIKYHDDPAYIEHVKQDRKEKWQQNNSGEYFE